MQKSLFDYFNKNASDVTPSRKRPGVPLTEEPKQSTTDNNSLLSEQQNLQYNDDSSPVKVEKSAKRPRRIVIDSDEDDDGPAEDCVATPKGAKKKNLAGAVGHDASSLSQSSPCSSHVVPKTTPMKDSVRSKLALFASPTTPRSSSPANDEATSVTCYPHLKLDFLQKENIRDSNRHRTDEPEYNPKTLYVPPKYLESLTPAMHQWWIFKSQYYDTLLFFKMGKFYELFHMDAAIAVSELGLIYMKGDVAHCGFPEMAFSRYADILIQKGYKVARIEQTETPDKMEERVKAMKHATKFDRVVRREVCQVSDKGTKTFNVLGEFEHATSTADTHLLMAICEQTAGGNVEFGICLADLSLGRILIGQFADDRHQSRLRTFLARYSVTHVLYEKNGASADTMRLLNNVLAGAIFDPLIRGSEFLTSRQALKWLNSGEYFAEKPDAPANGCRLPAVVKDLCDPLDLLCQTARSDGELALRALGAVIWYLKRSVLDYELLSKASFEPLIPFDQLSQPAASSVASVALPNFMLPGNRMVLDSITLTNLEVLCDCEFGKLEGSLLGCLQFCRTSFGSRVLRSNLCSPLTNPALIEDRLNAVDQLMPLLSREALLPIGNRMKQLPDLERSLSRFRTMGCLYRSKHHPESRAVMFEEQTYSKRKLKDFLSTLRGFKDCQWIIEQMAGVVASEKSGKMASCLKSVLTIKETDVAADAGKGHPEHVDGFPDLAPVLRIFDRAFDHAQAEKEGRIVPTPGLNEAYDDSLAAISEVQQQLDDYLVQQRRKLGCPDMNYFGTGRNRFQLEVPERYASKVPTSFRLESQRKGFKRYQNDELKCLLGQMMACEERKTCALQDTMRSLFAKFCCYLPLWQRAVACIAQLDFLLCLATYSAQSDSVGCKCRPRLAVPSANVPPFVRLRQGRHPCLAWKSDFVPNDTRIGRHTDVGPAKPILLLTGPNMGGKSTLMKQTALLALLAQLGCYVPAAEMVLTPVDRIFTRIGQSDRILGGESTFYVELMETSCILKHTTAHSLVLFDELGRGTATYDGTAIATSVLSEFADGIQCRTMFSTHYHSLNDAFNRHPAVQLCHMVRQQLARFSHSCRPCSSTLLVLSPFATRFTAFGHLMLPPSCFVATSFDTEFQC